MKHLLLLASFILLGFSVANCQTPDWVWARSSTISASGAAEGVSITADKANNLFITGFYQGSIAFDSYFLTDTLGVFLAKYDLNGNVKWAKTSLGYDSRGTSVATDIFGNSYVTGCFRNIVIFDLDTLVSVYDRDIFLVKYDSTGNVLWAKSAGGTGGEQGSGISTDTFGNIYITGAFGSPSITFGSHTITKSGASDIFLAKYDSAGNVLWARGAGGTGDDEGLSIATDVLGNVYLTGFFASASITLGAYSLTNSGSGDVFLAKYDSTGNVLWAKCAGGAGDDQGISVATDASNNAYLAGYYSSFSITFDTCTLSTAGANDGFLVKYDSAGNMLWAKSIGGSGNDVTWCVAADKFNNVYLTGGSSSLTIIFDTITLQLPSGFFDDMFIAAYDSSGNAIFAKALASGGDDWNAVSATSSGCIYIGGDFDPVSFVVGSDTLVNTSNAENVFVAKLCDYGFPEHVIEITPNKDFIFYPNPFTDKLNISLACNDPCAREDEERRLLLFDVTGRELLRCSLVNSATINTEHLARGIYFYEVRDKDGVGARGKVVKN